MRAVAHLGALQVLEANNLLSHVKEYIGVSAGAFLSFCLCIGYSLKELQQIVLSFDFQLIRNITPESMMDFPMTFGIDNGEKLMKLLHSVMRIKGVSQDITFAELPKEKSLRCFATDVYTCNLREFSREKSPTVKITTALLASMCLPAYFVPIEDPETGHLLVDGGVLHNYPMGFLTEEEVQYSIGITFTYEHTSVELIPDIGSFFYQIFACYYMPRTKIAQQKFKNNTILIPCGHVPAWDFEASVDDRKGLIQLGETATKEFLERKQLGSGEIRPTISRRYSVG
jgi:predicted acylesterase/phospholipase RssA